MTGTCTRLADSLNTLFASGEPIPWEDIRRLLVEDLLKPLARREHGWQSAGDTDRAASMLDRLFLEPAEGKGSFGDKLRLLFDGAVVQPGELHKFLIALRGKVSDRARDEAERRRAAKRGGDRQQEDLDVATGSLIAAGAVGHEQLDELEQALARMTEQQRLLLLLRSEDFKMSYADIAALLDDGTGSGISVSTIRRELERAKARGADTSLEPETPPQLVRGLYHRTLRELRQLIREQRADG